MNRDATEEEYNKIIERHSYYEKDDFQRFTCIMIGHDFSEFSWAGSCGVMYSCGVQYYDLHDEKRICKRCSLVERVNNLRGQYGADFWERFPKYRPVKGW